MSFTICGAEKTRGRAVRAPIFSGCIWLVCGCGIFAITPGWTRISRHGDFITLGGKFLRLTKKEAERRVKETKKHLLAL